MGLRAPFLTSPPTAGAHLQHHAPQSEKKALERDYEEFKQPDANGQKRQRLNSV